MEKSASEIVDRALTLLDEKPTEFTQAASTEMSLKEMGLELLPNVCRNLVRELPFELKELLAESGLMIVDTLTAGEERINALTPKKKAAWRLPLDYWEFSSIQFDEWSKAVTSYITVGSKDYERQNNPFTRSGTHEPVVAIAKIGNEDPSNIYHRLEVFSLAEDTVVVSTHVRYVSFDNVPDDEALPLGNRWDEKLFEVTAKALASELLVIKGKIAEGTARGDDVLTDIEQHE